MDARALVARNLRRLRVRKALSQEQLAVDAGVDRSYMSRLERGLENPTVAVLERLAAAVDAVSAGAGTIGYCSPNATGSDSHS